jgi:hypothetical protein
LGGERNRNDYQEGCKMAEELGMADNILSSSADEGTPVVGVDDGWQVVGESVGVGVEGANEEFVDLPNFDPAQAGAGVVGDPGGWMEFWHVQQHEDTDAIVAQQVILESIFGQALSEDALREEAIANGWYTPGGGMPLEHVGDLLEAHGINVVRTHSASFENLVEKLNEGQRVVVAVDKDEVWNPGQGVLQDEILGDFGRIPGHDANHVVEVIGIDNTYPANPMVILNDPSHPDGKGLMVPAEEFLSAWADSGNFMVSTVLQTVPGLPQLSYPYPST